MAEAEEGEKRQSLIDSAFDGSKAEVIRDPVGGNREVRGASSAIDTLRSELARGGLPQSNRFQLNINPPQNMPVGGQILRSMMIRTVSVDLPGNTLDTIPDNNIYGPNRNVVQGISYADSVDAKFLMDEDFEVHQYFQA